MPTLASVSESRRLSSVNDQLTILIASKSRVYNGSEQAQDIRQLRKEMDALRHRVVELEQGEEEHNRNYASARHMAALFEEYVSTATEEATAMLKSHETLKQQVESSEKLISILAEKIVTMVGTQANKVKEFEEIQVGHQTKITDIDQKQKELTHKVNQLKHNEKQSQSHTPRSHRATRTIGQGGGFGGGGGGGAGATHFAADSHALDEGIKLGRLESMEQSMESTRQVIFDQLRETKQQVDSVYGEIRRNNDQTKNQMEALKESIQEAREKLDLGEFLPSSGGSTSPGKTTKEKFRSSVHKINVLKAFSKKRMKSEAHAIAASPKNNVSNAVRSLSQVAKKIEEATPGPKAGEGKVEDIIPSSAVSLIQDGDGNKAPGTEPRTRRVTQLAGSGDAMFNFG
ncbi:hypothetical protein TrST_g12503 [Triparma strigata]|uniref:Uncharacterized protein n=1 Tax=Triparma strigata TaxID=1606541 RepID=A0A9W7B2A4_9STRA|nr:hypothetical protein TrST_g12503 [Triparma strigata]